MPNKYSMSMYAISSLVFVQFNLSSFTFVLILQGTYYIYISDFDFLLCKFQYTQGKTRSEQCENIYLQCELSSVLY